MIQLSDLIEAAKLQQEVELKIQELEVCLKELKENHRFQQTEVVPGMMQELGINSFELDNGYKVSIKDEYYGSIPDFDKEGNPNPNKALAFEWLRKNNLDGIIKTVVSLNFGKGEDEVSQDVLEWMVENGLTPNIKETVHPQTLKAFVKERMSAGLELPVDFFGATVVKTTVISK